MVWYGTVWVWGVLGGGCWGWFVALDVFLIALPPEPATVQTRTQTTPRPPRRLISSTVPTRLSQVCCRMFPWKAGDRGGFVFCFLFFFWL